MNQLSLLLLVDPDPKGLETLKYGFEREGCAVAGTSDPGLAPELARTTTPQLAVIALRQPEASALELITKLRGGSDTKNLPLVTLGPAAMRSAAMAAGASDFLPKPFEVEELLARVRALCRRNLDQARLLPLGEGWFDPDAHLVRLPTGEQVELSGQECRLLHELATRPRQVHTRAALRRGVFDGARAESIVDTYVYYLRSKLGTGVVRTIRGVGYRLGDL
jgi:two-component system response regulator QseB